MRELDVGVGAHTTASWGLVLQLQLATASHPPCGCRCRRRCRRQEPGSRPPRPQAPGCARQGTHGTAGCARRGHCCGASRRLDKHARTEPRKADRWKPFFCHIAAPPSRDTKQARCRPVSPTLRLLCASTCLVLLSTSTYFLLYWVPSTSTAHGLMCLAASLPGLCTSPPASPLQLPTLSSQPCSLLHALHSTLLILGAYAAAPHCLPA